MGLGLLWLAGFVAAGLVVRSVFRTRVIDTKKLIEPKLLARRRQDRFVNQAWLRAAAQLNLVLADDFLLKGVRNGYQVEISSKARRITRAKVWLKSEAARGFSVGDWALGSGKTSILPKEAKLLRPLWEEALSLETLANSEEVYGLFDCENSGLVSGAYTRDVPKRLDTPKALLAFVDRTISTAASLETALGCLAKHVETLFHLDNRDHQRRLLLQRLLIRTLPKSEAVATFTRTNLVVDEPLLQFEAAIFLGDEAVDTVCQLALRKDLDSKTRLAALVHLDAHLPAKSLAPILMHILNEKGGGPYLRYAVQSLGSMRHKPARAAIERLLGGGHANPLLDEAVLAALGDIGSVRSQTAILLKLEKLPAPRRLTALSVLGRIGDVECIGALRSLSFHDRETNDAIEDTIEAIAGRLKIDRAGGHLALSQEAGGDGGLSLAADDGGGLSLEKKGRSRRKKGPDEA